MFWTNFQSQDAPHPSQIFAVFYRHVIFCEHLINGENNRLKYINLGL